ncbi:NADH-quinone oxidoreductase subunit C [Limnochorda pilosa]|uniref:NADH-quinone oxidoreductase subunit C n=1 Tax=Limnochorda pilosa TaxID=1555112 RepID=A0A0K2SKN4_LIMPI|nr:NADH-quinone oxidoreductase subunit C [Limnochorda pilosa]BAS27663.1 NADH-quinone oxidoreductase subunit C [Limnochorda pilosa]
MADEEKDQQAKDGKPEQPEPGRRGGRRARPEGTRPARAQGTPGDAAGAEAPKAEGPARPARDGAVEHGHARPARKEEAPGPQDDAPELPEPLARALARIQARFPDLKARGRRDLWLEVEVEPGRLVEVATYLRDDPELRFDYLAMLSGVDRLEEGFEVVDHLTSLEKGLRLILRTRVPRSEPVCPSVTGVWPGADWHERETYDLMGVRFEGHPDLRRILLREDWEGHPLRKDYVDRRPPRRIQVKADWQRKA